MLPTLFWRVDGVLQRIVALVRAYLHIIRSSRVTSDLIYFMGRISGLTMHIRHLHGTSEKTSLVDELSLVETSRTVGKTDSASA